MESLPLSLLNDLLYCTRRAAFKAIEGVRSHNEHTVLGELAHEHADLPGYDVAKGVTILRALPVWSERLGLSGKCDVVEQHPDGSLVPVEYKKGRRRQFDNDDVQLCAQALCLEEMFNLPVPTGAVFHAQSKRRRAIIFAAELRQMTLNAVAELRRLIESGQVPPAAFKPACEECSLFEVCLPRATAGGSRAAQLAHELFQIRTP